MFHDIDIAEYLGTPELSETFSYLGEQIRNFISMYNSLTLGNNFDGMASLLPALLNLDTNLPSLKKKQFI